MAFPIPTSSLRRSPKTWKSSANRCAKSRLTSEKELRDREKLLMPASPLLDPGHLPTSNKIPVTTARIPMGLDGIGRRMRDDRPVSMSQTANSNIPIDTTPMVIDSSLLIPTNPLQWRGREYNRKVYIR